MLRPILWGAGVVLWTAALGVAQPPAAPQPPGTPPVPPGTTQPPPPGTPPALPGAPPAPGTTAPPTMTTPPKPPEWPKQVGGRSLGEWMADLKSPDPTIRDSAVKVIPLFGPEARKVATKELIRLIDDPDPGIRINTMLVLGGMGFDTKEDLRAAAKAMGAAIRKTAPGSMIRLHATRTLAGFGPEAYDAMADVLAIATDPSWETRQAVAAALGRLGAPLYEDPPAKSATPPKVPGIKRQASKLAMDKLVFAMLKDDSSAVRMEAMQSMIVLGPPHSPDPTGYIKLVTPYLDEINRRLRPPSDRLAEKDPAVRIWLLVVQMMYDDRTIKDNTKKLAEHITGSDPNLKVQALNGLAVLGPQAKPVLGEVIEATRDTDANVVAAAITTLLGMGDAAKYAVEDLEKAKAAAKDEGLKKLLDEGIKAIKGTKPGEPAPKKNEPKKP